MAPGPTLLRAKQLIDRRNEQAAETLRHTLCHNGAFSEVAEPGVSV